MSENIITRKRLEKKSAKQTHKDPPTGGATGSGGPGPARLSTTPCDEIKPRPIEYLVPGIIPLGKLILIAGNGGLGKSATTLGMAADLSMARPCFGLDYVPTAAVDTLLISCEDDYEDTVIPRLLAAGANLKRIHRVDGVRGEDGKLLPFGLHHYESLAAYLKKHPNIGFVSIDPAGSYVGRSGVNDHKDSELRTLLDPLAEKAAEHRVTIALTKHLNKGASPEAVHRVSGSTGYVNAVRAAFIVVPDAQDLNERLFLPLKFNIGPKPEGLRYRLTPLSEINQKQVLRKPAFSELSEPQKETMAKQLFAVEWLGRSDIDADAALKGGSQRERSPKRVAACADWLKEFLKDFAFPSKEIEAAAEKAGFTQDNVFRAKASLKEAGLQNRPRGDGWWSGFGPPADWLDRPHPDEIPE
jgi:AAA domain